MKGANREKEVFVNNLSEFRVSSWDDIFALLKRGEGQRTVRSTEMNSQSSRSHAILQLLVEVHRASDDGKTIITKAKLNLVDLAGSEKWNTMGKMQRGQARELVNINKSLSALGNVITALTQKGRSHVPYRDSKLTRLLQDALGGNSATTLIATCAPTPDCIEESISTLKFADRASRVRTKVRVNEVVDDAVLLKRAHGP